MKVGIYGFIGSGKTTVISYLKKSYGFQILNLDEISKIVLDQEIGLSFIRNYIPEAYNLKTNSINRAKLREVLFTNKKQNKLFGRIIWPEIGLVTNQLLSQIPEGKNVVIEGAILPVLDLQLDKLILIETKSQKEILRRIKFRDHYEETQIKALLKIQKSWLKNTDFDVLMKNDSTVEDLFLKIDKLMTKYKIKKMH